MMICRHVAGDPAPGCEMCQDLERLISLRVRVLLENERPEDAEEHKRLQRRIGTVPFVDKIVYTRSVEAMK